VWAAKSENLLFVRQSRIWLRQTSLRLSCGLRPSALCRFSQQKRAGEACPFLGKGKETHYYSSGRRDRLSRQHFFG
jgi:hypothetical protein